MMVREALQAAEKLALQGVRVTVVDMFSVKPFDEDLVLRYARKTGAVVVCENHRVSTGVGSAMAAFLLQRCPVPFRIVGVGEEFGEVGDMNFLLKRFKLESDYIVSAVNEVLKRKQHVG